MLNAEKIQLLDQHLKRIFAMPISRSTLREVQNVLLVVTDNSNEKSSALFQMLLTGDIKVEGSNGTKEHLQRLINNYLVHTRLAKDVFEKGEYLNLISSDIIAQGERFSFLHRIKRVDGQEIQFLTDIEMTLQLITHFANRFSELQKNEGGKKVVSQLREKIDLAKKAVEKL